VEQPNPHWEFAETHFEQGNTLYNEGQVKQAITCYNKALELHPDMLPARFNLGVALGNQEQFQQAVKELTQVVADEAGHAEAYNSLGFVYGQMGEHTKAIASFEKAVAIRTDFAQAHHNLGMELLKQGDYPRGWEECEWRWKTAQIEDLNTNHPRWDGSVISEQTLLIHTEQGAGDAIQFARFLPMAAEHCSKLILICPANLISLLSTLPGVSECRGPGKIDKHEFDFHLSLMSLPHVLHISLDNLPAETYIKADKLENCQLTSTKDIPRIGIVWAGNLSQGNDANRSSPLCSAVPRLVYPLLPPDEPLRCPHL